MVAAMNQPFNNINEIIRRFDMVQIDRIASIMQFRQNKNKYEKPYNKFSQVTKIIIT